MEDSDIKIVDFGISKEIEKEYISYYYSLEGTNKFLAPEQFKGIMTLKTDIWIFGCTLLQLATGV